jgi:serine protease Do
MAGVNQFVPISIGVGSELAEVAERLRHCTVAVRAAGPGSGSGVIWRSDGLIVTNAHVATSSRHTVELADGRIFQAELVRHDLGHDLAALQISATGLSAAQVRDASSLRTGEVVLAVGNPMGVAGAFTVGIVSARPRPDDVLVRADIRLAPGNSGGPLADADGRVVGINSMIVGGFGIAVASAAVEGLFAGNERRSIGVTVQPTSVHVEGRPMFGLMIVELEAGGPAHLSGVLIGDVIVRANGEWLTSPAQLSDAIWAHPGALLLHVLRAGRLEQCEVTLTRESFAEVG